MIDIDWLNTFRVLSEYQHFRQASEALHMTQPNVSLQLKLLEQKVNTKLVERHPFRLTPAGERLLISAEKVIAELTACEQDIAAMLSMETGFLRLATSDTLARYVLMDTIKEFYRQHRQLDLHLHNATSSEVQDLVAEGKADIGVLSLGLDEAPKKHLHFQPVNRFSWQLVSNRNLGKTRLGLSAIGRFPLVLLDQRSRSRQVIDQHINSPTQVMSVASIEAQLHWVSAGLGHAIVPNYVPVTEGLWATKITGLPQQSLGYVLRESQVPSPATKWFIGEFTK